MRSRKDTIALGLFFCRDVRDAQSGRAILGSIVRCFRSTRWRFSVSDERMTFEEFEEYVEAGGRLDDLSEDRPTYYTEFLSKRWAVTDPGPIALVGFSDESGDIRVEIWLPPPGGSVLIRTQCGLCGSLGMLSIRIEDRCLTEQIEHDLEKSFCELAPLLRSCYGFVARESQLPAGWAHPEEFLAGVYWLTCFGPDVQKELGESRFKGLPGCEVTELTDGTLIVKIARKFRESFLRPNRRHANQIRHRLGLLYFLPPYPILRLFRRYPIRFRDLRIEGVPRQNSEHL